MRKLLASSGLLLVLFAEAGAAAPLRVSADTGPFTGGAVPAAPYQGWATNTDTEPGLSVDGAGNFWIGGNPSGRHDARYTGVNPVIGEDVWRSSDGGRTYQWVASPFSTVDPNTPGFGSEDSDIASAVQQNAAGCYNLYAASLWIVSSALAWSQDCGVSWQSIPLGTTEPEDDRPWLAPDGACAVYLVEHVGGGSTPMVNHYDFCNPASTSVTTVSAPSNTFGKIWVDNSTVSPFQHHLYMPLEIANPVAGTHDHEIAVEVSGDGGATYTLRNVAEDLDTQGEVWPASVVTDTAGRVYVSWFDRAHSWLASSGDGGTTWGAPVRIDSSPVGSSAYPTVAAGQAGQVGVAFYGSTTSGDPNNATQMGAASSANGAVWSVWWAASSDAGNTFTLTKASPTVHAGQLCTRGDGCSAANSRNLYDDFGAAIDPRSGSVSIAYTTDQPDGQADDIHLGYASLPAGGGTAGGGPAPGTLGPGFCTVAAQPVHNARANDQFGTADGQLGRNEDQFAMDALGIAYDATGNLSVRFRVQSLVTAPGVGPNITAAGDDWELRWTGGDGAKHVLSAIYPGIASDPTTGGIPFTDYNEATIGNVLPSNPANVTQSLEIVTAAARGSMNPADGTITISAPASDFGLHPGDSLPIAAYTNDVLVTVPGKYYGGSSADQLFAPAYRLGTSCVTSLATSPSAPVTGQPVTLTASLSGGTAAPTGIVTFREGDAVLGAASFQGGQAVLSIAFASAGQHAISATYGGDSVYPASVGRSTVTVAPAATALQITSRNPSSTFGQPVTFTANVAVLAPGSGTAGGVVTFEDGTAALGSATLSAGTASLTISGLEASTHQVRAVYGGDADHLGSSSTLTQTVARATPGMALAASPNPDARGQTFALTARLGGPHGVRLPTGTVVFAYSGVPIGTAAVGADGSATVWVSFNTPGTRTVTAVYGGDADYTGASGSITVTTAPTLR